MFAQYAWPADCGLAAPSEAATPLYTLSDRRVIVTELGSKKREYRGRYQDGRESGWLTEIEILGNFTLLQLDVFHALWNLYHPHAVHGDPAARKKRPTLTREEAFQLFPVGTKIAKPMGNIVLDGEVNGFYTPYWRVRYKDNNWEELSKREMDRFAKG